MKSKHLLVIEDEKEIREMIELVLKRQHYQVTSLSHGEEFLFDQKNRNITYDLIVLDWMLPGQSGVELLKKVRQDARWNSIPVLMVTAKTEPSEIAMGLNTGADDYLTKPFDIMIFLTRVKALLRRSSPLEESTPIHKNTIKRGALTLHLENYEAFYKEKKLSLTLTEYKILAIMIQNPGKVFTREQLVKYMHGEAINVVGRTIDTHVFSLRRKLGDMGYQIETERGVGYCYRNSEDES